MEKDGYVWSKNREKFFGDLVTCEEFGYIETLSFEEFLLQHSDIVGQRIIIFTQGEKGGISCGKGFLHPIDVDEARILIKPKSVEDVFYWEVGKDPAADQC